MVLLYWPSAQGVHEALPPLAYSPGTQVRHDSCPGDEVQLDEWATLLYWPAGQLVQDPELFVAAYLPPVQSPQAIVGLFENRPAGHTTQDHWLGT